MSPPADMTREEVADAITNASLPDRLRMAANMIGSDGPKVVELGRIIIESVMMSLPTSPSVVKARRVEAVRALTAAGGWDTAGLGDMIDVCESIDAMRAYLVDPEFTGDKSRDVAALHALAVLLAAMTEPT